MLLFLYYIQYKVNYRQYFRYDTCYKQQNQLVMYVQKDIVYMQ